MTAERTIEDPHPLVPFGWTDRVAALVATDPANGGRPGRVTRVDRGALRAVTATTDVTLLAPAEPVAVGDWVTLHRDRDVVASVLPRWSLLRRRSSDGGDGVVAANVDVVAIAVAMDRPFNGRRLERFLALAWEAGARPIVCLTKTDLGDAAPVLDEASRLAVGTDVLPTSAETGEGIDGVLAHLTAGETLALIGESGAGKSTLINALLGREAQATGGVRTGDHKGRHTTSSRQLVALAGGIVLLDTPGVRSVGLPSGDATSRAVDRTFADLTALAEDCRFRDCRHDGEPGCAVTAAVEGGALDHARLASYRKLQRELAHHAMRDDVRSRRALAREWGRSGREAKAAKQRLRRDQ